jgi:rhodanese-related sulfurtransferase
MRTILISIASIISFLGFGQSVGDSDYEKMLNRLLIHNVPQTEVSKIDTANKQILYLDAREEEEFNVSHVANAKWVGYKKFSIDSMSSIPKDTEIIVYCSVGFRSGSIAKKLIKNGYTKVLNLYGGLFEWSNQELPLVDSVGKPTSKIHPYNKKWGKWIKKGEKSYE